MAYEVSLWSLSLRDGIVIDFGSRNHIYETPLQSLSLVLQTSAPQILFCAGPNHVEGIGKVAFTSGYMSTYSNQDNSRDSGLGVTSSGRNHAVRNHGLEVRSVMEHKELQGEEQCRETGRFRLGNGFSTVHI